MAVSAGKPVIGLALGSGASRGWSHVGVIKALVRAGIEPAIICGTSVGAMVGASYAAGNLEKLEEWVLGSSRGDVFSFFNFKLSRTAFVDIDRLNSFLHNFVAPADARIEALPLRYAAVCTNLDDGEEVWLQEGPVDQAVRASMAMPGLFPAERQAGRWLIDGGLVNPVPVTPCRAFGADFVIGVNLNSDILHGRNAATTKSPAPAVERILGTLKNSALIPDSIALKSNTEEKAPGVLASISRSINIFQDQITRGKIKQDPADVMIAPRLRDIRMLDFQRAADAIRHGDECVVGALNEIRQLIDAR